MSEKIRRAAAKIKKANHGRWKELSTGEKIIKAVLWLIKIALVCVFGLAIGIIILSCVIAVGIMNGITGAINGQVRRSWDYHHRNWW